MQNISLKQPVAVFWDAESAKVPSTVDPRRVARNMVFALRQAGLSGGIRVTAFLNTTEEHEELETGLADTGIVVRGIPKGGREAVDKIIMFWISLWTTKCHPAANILMVSGDFSCWVYLKKLKEKGYVTSLVCPSTSSVSHLQKRVAACIWDWDRFVEGEIAGLSAAQKLQTPPPPAPPPQPLVNNPLNPRKNPRPLRIMKARLRRVLMGRGHKGILISELKKAMEAGGEPFDYKSLGHTKLTNFIESVPDVAMLRVEAGGRAWVSISPEARKRKRGMDNEDEGLRPAEFGFMPPGVVSRFADVRKLETGGGGVPLQKNPPAAAPPQAPPKHMPMRIVKGKLRTILTERGDKGILLSDVMAAMEGEDRPFDYKALGYPKLRKLLVALPDTVRIGPAPEGLPPADYVYLAPNAKPRYRDELFQNKAAIRPAGEGNNGNDKVDEGGKGLGAGGRTEGEGAKRPPVKLSGKALAMAEAKEELRRKLSQAKEGVLLSKFKFKFEHLGYKKLIRFLRAVPDVVDVLKEGPGNHRVFLVEHSPAKNDAQKGSEVGGAEGGGGQQQSEAAMEVITGQDNKGKEPLAPRKRARSMAEALEDAKERVRKVLVAHHPQGLPIDKIRPLVELDGGPLDYNTFGFLNFRLFMEAMSDVASIDESVKNHCVVHLKEGTEALVTSDPKSDTAGSLPSATILSDLNLLAAEATAGSADVFAGSAECPSERLTAGSADIPAGQQQVASLEVCAPTEPAAGLGEPLSQKEIEKRELMRMLSEVGPPPSPLASQNQETETLGSRKRAGSSLQSLEIAARCPDAVRAAAAEFLSGYRELEAHPDFLGVALSEPFPLKNEPGAISKSMRVVMEYAEREKVAFWEVVGWL